MATPYVGSPPRVRGIPYEDLTVLGVVRITPACAGNTFHQLQIQRYWWDHPRVCGEYNAPVLMMWAALGSPPRVRGIHHSLGGAGNAVRITPACAGNTVQVFAAVDLT